MVCFFSQFVNDPFQFFFFGRLVFSVPFATINSKDIKQGKGRSFMNRSWNGKTINFLGDSITQGCGSEIAYPHIVKKLLKLKEARNYGVSATHISGAYEDKFKDSAGSSLSFTKRCLRMEPADLLCIFGGTNDFGHRDTAPLGRMADREDIGFYGALHWLIETVRKNYPQMEIVLFTPLHRCSDPSGEMNPYTGHTLLEYVEAIRAIAEYYHLPVLDLYQDGPDPRRPKTKELLIPDGLHPNTAGHQLIAKELIVPFLNAL